ncbi:recombinase A [Croceibacter atlanticus HTCC2559]|uniref:Recombinase A n=1 Tax=Croceibacter atlanticus (strain ATCC BAA-628 / JCM 21780 / CIP 108009 / IAM 15332 / KCTC 12090 / HTCC2559) TaxID=216432 RepID=A3U6B7_CROAH|nr:recombinase A [Croceibacter atlanticus HTCC2559]
MKFFQKTIILNSSGSCKAAILLGCSFKADGG